MPAVVCELAKLTDSYYSEWMIHHRASPPPRPSAMAAPPPKRGGGIKRPNAPSESPGPGPSPKRRRVGGSPRYPDDEDARRQDRAVLLAIRVEAQAWTICEATNLIIRRPTGPPTRWRPQTQLCKPLGPLLKQALPFLGLSSLETFIVLEAARAPFLRSTRLFAAAQAAGIFRQAGGRISGETTVRRAINRLRDDFALVDTQPASSHAPPMRRRALEARLLARLCGDDARLLVQWDKVLEVLSSRKREKHPHERFLAPHIRRCIDRARVHCRLRHAKEQETQVVNMALRPLHEERARRRQSRLDPARRQAASAAAKPTETAQKVTKSFFQIAVQAAERFDSYQERVLAFGSRERRRLDALEARLAAGAALDADERHEVKALRSKQRAAAAASETLTQVRELYESMFPEDARSPAGRALLGVRAERRPHATYDPDELLVFCPGAGALADALDRAFQATIRLCKERASGEVLFFCPVCGDGRPKRAPETRRALPRFTPRNVAWAGPQEWAEHRRVCKRHPDVACKRDSSRLNPNVKKSALKTLANFTQSLESAGVPRLLEQVRASTAASLPPADPYRLLEAGEFSLRDKEQDLRWFGFFEAAHTFAASFKNDKQRAFEKLRGVFQFPVAPLDGGVRVVVHAPPPRPDPLGPLLRATLPPCEGDGGAMGSRGLPSEWAALLHFMGRQSKEQEPPQARAFDALRRRREKVPHTRVWAYSVGAGGVNGYLVGTPAEIHRAQTLSRPEDRRVLELLEPTMPCFLYVDLEVYEHQVPRERWKELLDEARERLRALAAWGSAAALRAAGHDPDEVRWAVYETDSSRGGKLSRHFVVRPAPGHPVVRMQNPFVAGALVRHLVLNLPSDSLLVATDRTEAGEVQNISVIDILVYTNNRLMRCVGSTKFGQCRPLYIRQGTVRREGEEEEEEVFDESEAWHAPRVWDQYLIGSSPGLIEDEDPVVVDEDHLPEDALACKGMRPSELWRLREEDAGYGAEGGQRRSHQGRHRQGQRPLVRRKVPLGSKVFFPASVQAARTFGAALGGHEVYRVFVDPGVRQRPDRFMVAMKDHYCPFEHREHASNTTFCFVDLSEREVVWRCSDPLCEGKVTPPKPISPEDIQTLTSLYRQFRARFPYPEDLFPSPEAAARSPGDQLDPTVWPENEWDSVIFPPGDLWAG